MCPGKKRGVSFVGTEDSLTKWRGIELQKRGSIVWTESGDGLNWQAIDRESD